MLLLRTNIKETITARVSVLGYTIDAAMEPIMAGGRSPKKMLNETDPSRKAFPKDSFFLMKNRTSINTIPTLTMAGICCRTDNGCVSLSKKMCILWQILFYCHEGTKQR